MRCCEAKYAASNRACRRAFRSNRIGFSKYGSPSATQWASSTSSCGPPTQSWPASGLLVERAVEATSLRVLTRAQEAIDAIGERLAQSVQAAHTEMVRIGGGNLAGGPHRSPRTELRLPEAIVAGLHDRVLDHADASEKNLKAQAALIESTRIAVAQIEGLVEGVVDALEALQCAALEQHPEAAQI